MALIGDVADPFIYERRGQKLLKTYQQPLRQMKFNFRSAFPMPNSKDGIPIFGIGTWQVPPEEVGPMVRSAIEAGYRHIDCAQVYGNQEAVGEAINKAIADGLVKREDLWITTKVWNTYHSFYACGHAITDMLKKMQLTYFDLVLIHWPMGYEEGGEMFPWANASKTAIRYSEIDFTETYKALELAHMEKKIRHFGVSNFGIGQIMRLVRLLRPKPHVVQCEIHAFHSQLMLREYCHSEGIALIAYSPLASPASPFRNPRDPNVFTNAVITEIANAHNCTNAQVALRFLMNKGCGVIPKSLKPERMVENAKAMQLMLTEEDMEKLEKLNKDKRFVCLKKRDGKHIFYPWVEEL